MINKIDKEIIKLFAITYCAILIISLLFSLLNVDYSLVRWLIIMITPIVIGVLTAFNFYGNSKFDNVKTIHDKWHIKLIIILAVCFLFFILGEQLTSSVLVPLLDGTFNDAVQRSKVGYIAYLIFDYDVFKSFALVYISYLITYYMIFLSKKSN